MPRSTAILLSVSLTSLRSMREEILSDLSAKQIGMFRIRSELESVALVPFAPQEPDVRDHRRVVGAARERGNEKARPDARAELGGAGTKPRIRRHPAGKDQPWDITLLTCRRCLAREHFDHSVLKCRAKIGQLGFAPGDAVFFYMACHGRLEPRKREIEPLRARHRQGELDLSRVSLFCEPIDDRTSRITEPKELGGFVEGFASGVVTGLSQELDVLVTAHFVDGRVAAACQKTNEWKLGSFDRSFAPAEIDGEEVGDEVIDIDERNVSRPSHRFGGRHPDQKRAEQTWSTRHGDRIDAVPSSRHGRERSLDHR